MKLDLTLLPQTRAARPGPAGGGAVAAWFLAGAEPEKWLDELARLGWAEAGTRLFVVPRSLTDQTPAGLLVLPEQAAPPGDRIAGGFACASVAERLFLPVEARLHPPMTEAEVRELCRSGVTFVHPTLGVSVFGDEDVRRVWDLLETPEERVEHWHCARAGDPPLPGLLGIVLDPPPTLAEVFGAAGEDIGSKPLQELPPSPTEPKPGAAAARKLKGTLMKALSGLLRNLPHTGTRRTWVNDLEDWAARQLKGLEGQLDRLRNLELHRLLNLLETDPESGLRHAIPMNQFAHRGVGPPGARLPEHPLDFDPARLGGRPADCWSVPPNLELQLRRLYREMAARELRLGRHRRAAYIYAELLGDLPAAANVLKQGGLFREAALVYEEHLHNLREAARCLAEGGLLVEAIERYERLELWLEAAELHERLGQHAAAAVAIRRVVEERKKAGDLLGAAHLVEERLRDPEEALRLLASGWESSPQAVACLRASLELLGRLSRHDAIVERVLRLRRDPLATALVPAVLEVLGQHAQRSAAQEVRHVAADVSRVLIARRLEAPGAGPEEAAALLRALQELAPQDRLLARDANRQLAAIRQAHVPKHHLLPPPPRPGRAPIVLRRFQLPRPLRWLEVQSVGPWFFALGLAMHRQLLLLRGVWEGEFQGLSWTCDPYQINRGVIFAPYHPHGRRIVLATAGGPPLPEKTFPSADQFFNQDCRVGTPSWLPTASYPFAIGDEVAWAADVGGGGAVLAAYSLQGNLVTNFEVTDGLLRDATRGPNTRLCLAAFESSAALALGNRLLIARSSVHTDRIDLPGQVVGLRPSLRHTRQGVVAVLEEGAVLHWRGTDGLVELDRDLPSPSCAFVPGGPIVLVSGTSGLLLEVQEDHVAGVTRFEPACRHPVAVCSGASMGQFAVFGANGEVVVYQTSRS
jgi:tetratricopeptide (TPR) repeat protein